MSKILPVLVALVLVAGGFALGRYAAPSQPVFPKPVPPAPQENLFPPRQPQTRLSEPILRPSPTRDPVMEQVLAALREPDAFTRVTRLAELLPSLDADAIPEVHAALDDYALDLGPAEYDLLLRFWATDDPAGAAAWVSLRAPGPYREVSTLAVIETWAAVNPGGAHDHVSAISLLPSESSRVSEIALVRGWFQSGLPGLGEYIQTLGLGEPRQRAIGVFARKTIQRDGSAAIIRWAESVPGDVETLKLDVNRHVAKELVRVDPAAAIAFCEAHCDGPFGSSMRQSIAQNWAYRDGRAAMEWVRNEPAGQERDWAVRGAYRGWIRWDPEGFLAWLDAMEVAKIEPWFEPVLEEMPKWLITQDPARAIGWASAIRDPQARERTLVIIARRWTGLDPGAAEAWLAQSPLSEAARDRVRDPNPPTKGQRRSREADPLAEDPPSNAPPAS
jgi:hypothetical protein